jgi:vancomycin resistance protein YoaR
VTKKFLKNFHRKKGFHFLGLLTALLVCEAGYFILRSELSQRLPFGLRVANAEYSLKPTTETIEKIKTQAAEYLKQSLHFTLASENFEISPSQIGLEIEVSNALTAASRGLVVMGDFTLPVKLEEEKLKELLLTTKPDLEYAATDAKVIFEEGKLKILPEKSGKSVDWKKLAQTIKENAGILSSTPIAIETIETTPRLVASDLEPFQKKLEATLPTPLTLKETEYRTFQINLAERLAWFDFATRYHIADRQITLPGRNLLNSPDSETVIFLKQAEFSDFVKSELGRLVEKLPKAVKISQTTDGKIIFEGIATDGREVDIEKLYASVSEALNGGNREIQIPFKKLPAPVNVDSALQKLGIVELIGESTTDYTGSPEDRKHNIQNAADKINGYLLAPGKEFSFVNILGPITQGTGYINGLVIKKGEIEPEIGGGVCQVSTTIFRSALDAALPITEQAPHSMKVTYYNPPGLDATIYPGQQDLKFKNDTGNTILIQTFVEGATLQINLYGKSDSREAEIVGPFYPDGSPVRNLDKAGMKMYWLRNLSQANGEKTTEKYSASYKLMPKH